MPLLRTAVSAFRYGGLSGALWMFSNELLRRHTRVLLACQDAAPAASPAAVAPPGIDFVAGLSEPVPGVAWQPREGWNAYAARSDGKAVAVAVAAPPYYEDLIPASLRCAAGPSCDLSLIPVAGERSDPVLAALLVRFARCREADRGRGTVFFRAAVADIPLLERLVAGGFRPLGLLRDGHGNGADARPTPPVAASPPPAIRVREVREADGPAWDRFCTDHGVSYGAYFHWREVLPRTRRQPLFLLAEDAAGKIVGCLPVAIARGILARCAVSAWGDGQACGGPLVATPAAIAPLLAAAESRLRALGVASFSPLPHPCQPWFDEVRAALEQRAYRLASPRGASVLVPLDEEKVGHIFRIPLDGGFEATWKRFHKKIRQHFRAALRHGVTIREVGTEEFLEHFHPLQVGIWKRLGNTCPSLGRMRLVLSHPAHRLHTFLASVEGQVVGGLYYYRAGRTCFIKGGLCADSHVSLGINNLLDVHAIEHAAAHGCEAADLGFTPPPRQSGHHAYKTQYNGTAHPLLTYKLALRPWLSLADSALQRLVNPVARKLSYGHPLLDLLGPVGRSILRWTRR